MSLIQRLSDRCYEQNSTIDDWILLIEAIFETEPAKIPLLIEIFVLKAKIGYTFRDAFDHCKDKYLEGIDLQIKKMSQP